MSLSPERREPSVGASVASRPARDRQDLAPVRRGRGRPRDPATDRRIIEAAANLMLRRGYERTTVDDVAAAAGVGKATVYRRWPTKGDLVVAAMEELYGDEMLSVDTGSIVSDLVETYAAVLAFVNSPEGAAYLTTSISESVRDERVAALYRRASERAERQGRRMFERAVERGEVRPDVDLNCAVEWVGGIIANRAITGRPMPSQEEAAAMVDFCLYGVSATPRDSGA